jgi:hypothetical protein
MCHLEEAGFCGMCSGEGSLFMTKQLRLQQGIVQGLPGQHFLSGSISPSKLHPSAYGGSAAGRSQERTD